MGEPSDGWAVSIGKSSFNGFDLEPSLLSPIGVNSSLDWFLAFWADFGTGEPNETWETFFTLLEGGAASGVSPGPGDWREGASSVPTGGKPEPKPGGGKAAGDAGLDGFKGLCSHVEARCD